MKSCPQKLHAKETIFPEVPKVAEWYADTIRESDEVRLVPLSLAKIAVDIFNLGRRAQVFDYKEKDYICQEIAHFEDRSQRTQMLFNEFSNERIAAVDRVYMALGRFRRELGSLERFKSRWLYRVYSLTQLYQVGFSPDHRQPQL